MTNATQQKLGSPHVGLVEPHEQREAVLRAIETMSTVVRLKRGDRLDIGPGRAKLVFVVQTGYLILQTNLQCHEQSALALYGPGSILRVSDLPALRSFSAIATLPCRVLRSTEAALERLNGEAPDVQSYCKTQQALQCARDMAHIVLLSRFSGEQRLASFFVEMAHQIGQRHGPAVLIEIPLAHRDIANLLALNPDTFSRIFSRLKTAGLLKSSGRRSIEIPDLSALTALVPGN